MKKKTLLVLITTTVLGLMPAPAKADCVRTCEGKLWAHFSYKPDEPGDIVRSTTDMVYVPGSELSRDGRSGSCSGAVGRQRARIRACEEVIRSLWANYANKLPAIKQAICEGGDATPEYLRLAQWIVVDRAEARAVAYATSSGHSRYAAGTRITAHTDKESVPVPRTRFSCRTAAPPPPPTLVSTHQVDTDRPGGDYHSSDMDSWMACSQACMAEARCRAWTWVKPGIQGPRAKCWLKSVVPAPRHNDCCVSGVKG